MLRALSSAARMSVVAGAGAMTASTCLCTTSNADDQHEVRFVKGLSHERTYANVNGDDVDGARLADRIVGLYFSAGWCPPCRDFTPKLAEFYARVRDASGGAGGDGPPLEIVFVSLDHTEAAAREYMRSSHGDWLAARYDDPLRAGLKQGMPQLSGGETSIPRLVILGAETSLGRPVVDLDGRDAVEWQTRQWASSAEALDVSTCFSIWRERSTLVQAQVLEYERANPKQPESGGGGG